MLLSRDGRTYVILRPESYFGYCMVATSLYSIGLPGVCIFYMYIGVLLICSEEEDPGTYERNEYQEQELEYAENDLGYDICYDTQPASLLAHELEEIEIPRSNKPSKIKYNSRYGKKFIKKYKIFGRRNLFISKETEVKDFDELDQAGNYYDYFDDIFDFKMFYVDYAKYNISDYRKFCEQTLTIANSAKIAMDTQKQGALFAGPYPFECHDLPIKLDHNENIILKKGFDIGLFSIKLPPYYCDLLNIEVEGSDTKRDYQDFTVYGRILNERLTANDLFTREEERDANQLLNFRLRARLGKLKIHKWVTNHYIHQTLVSTGVYTDTALQTEGKYFSSQHLYRLANKDYELMFVDPGNVEIGSSSDVGLPVHHRPFFLQDVKYELKHREVERVYKPQPVEPLEGMQPTKGELDIIKEIEKGKQKKEVHENWKKNF